MQIFAKSIPFTAAASRLIHHSEFRLPWAVFVSCTSIILFACRLVGGSEFLPIDFGAISGIRGGTTEGGISLSGSGDVAMAFNWDGYQQYIWQRNQGSRNITDDLQLHTLVDDTKLRVLSWDGKYAAGNAFGSGEKTPEDTFRWSLSDEEFAPIYSTRMRTLGGTAWPTGISSDGSVIVGFGKVSTPRRTEPFIWSKDGGVEWLGTLPDRVNMDATALSTDGSVVVGYAHDPCCDDDSRPGYAARWTSQTGWQRLEESDGHSFAHLISADGSVISGGTSSTLGAFRWTETDGMVGLGTLSGPWAISGDGNVIVGGSGTTVGTPDASMPAFVWSQETGLVELGPGNMLDVSADGKAVIGYVEKEDNYLASVWDQANGLRDLKSVLVNEHGMAGELEGWQLTRALQLSDDAATVLGWGIAPSGEESTWIALLDRALITAQRRC